MKDNLSKIKRKEMVLSLGKMVNSIMVIGKMESNMVLQSIIILKESRSMGCGNKEIESNGLLKRTIRIIRNLCPNKQWFVEQKYQISNYNIKV